MDVSFNSLAGLVTTVVRAVDHGLAAGSIANARSSVEGNERRKASVSIDLGRAIGAGDQSSSKGTTALTAG